MHLYTYIYTRTHTLSLQKYKIKKSSYMFISSSMAHLEQANLTYNPPTSCYGERAYGAGNYLYLGTYDPIPKKPDFDESAKLYKDIKLDISRAKYWLGCGAQPSDPARRLLAMVCFFFSCV
jgi:small subunit ribosomal protein S16